MTPTLSPTWMRFVMYHLDIQLDRSPALALYLESIGRETAFLPDISYSLSLSILCYITFPLSMHQMTAKEKEKSSQMQPIHGDEHFNLHLQFYMLNGLSSVRFIQLTQQGYWKIVSSFAHRLHDQVPFFSHRGSQEKLFSLSLLSIWLIYPSQSRPLAQW